MLESDSIIGIYSYSSSEHIKDDGQVENVTARYCFKYIFDENGLIDFETLKKVNEEMFSKETVITKNSVIGYFEDVAALNKYATYICEIVDASKISLVSLQDYNTILENISSATELKDQLLLKGSIQYPSKDRKGGILRKIFR